MSIAVYKATAMQPSYHCIQCNSIFGIKYYSIPDFFYCSYCNLDLRRSLVENILYDFSNFTRNSSNYNSSSLCIACSKRNVLHFNGRYTSCAECKVEFSIEKLIKLESIAQETILCENIFNIVFPFTGD